MSSCVPTTIILALGDQSLVSPEKPAQGEIQGRRPMLRATQRLRVQLNRLQVLKYEYVHDVMEKRGPHREGHIALAKKWKDAGKVKLGGAFDPASQGAMIVFAPGVEAAEIEADFVRQDPYVAHGVVKGWEIAAWNDVVENL